MSVLIRPFVYTWFQGNNCLIGRGERHFRYTHNHAPYMPQAGRRTTDP